MTAGDICRRYPLFAALDAQRLDSWLATGRSVTVEMGETLFQAGTPGEFVYVIQEGRARVLRTGRNGREVTLGKFGPGELFGEYAVLPPGKNTATCRAGGPGRLFRLPLGPLGAMLAEQPELQIRRKAWLRLHAAVAFLRGNTFLGFLSAPSLQPLIDAFGSATFPAGNAIQADGLHADHFFVIRSGEVVVHGDTTSILQPGDCFGVAALLGRPGLTFAEARTTAECWSLPAAAFDGQEGGSGLSVQTYLRTVAKQQAFVWVGQEEAADCGLAALAMVARYHGRETSLTTLRQRVPLEARGSNLLTLQRAAESLGFSSRGVCICPEHLADVTLPTIAHLTDGHYVVVYACDPARVVVGDPATGIVTISFENFVRDWSRNLLLILPPAAPAAPLAPQKSPTGAAMAPEPTFTTVQLHAYIDQLRAGDRNAAEGLLRRTCGRLDRLASRMLKSFPNVKRWADTDDVLQSALMRLLHSLDAIRPESTRDFFNLAAVHIRRELLDLARRFRGRLERNGPLAGVNEEDNPDVLATAGIDKDLDLWSAFHEQVEQLPADQREVVGLTFYHGWTQPQIAELIGVDERTIRRRWRTACAALSQALGGRLPEV